jgi:hypothetical protein
MTHLGSGQVPTDMRERLQALCTLHLARFLKRVNGAEIDPHDLWCTAWFGGHDAGTATMPELADIERELELIRSGAPRPKAPGRKRALRAPTF